MVVLFVAFWLSRGLTRQVNNIVAAFGQIGMGDFTARARVVSRDELGTMAANLNAMLAGIDDPDASARPQRR